MADGWSQLGALFGGGDNLGRTSAYQQGALQGSRLESAMLDARKRRDAEIGRQQAAQAASDAGDNELADAILQGFGTPNAISAYRTGAQTRGFRDSAMGIARNPHGDLNELNRMMLVIGGKPTDLTTIRDHTVFNPLETPDSQPLTTNELGQAMIGLDQARQATERAHQGAYGAQARASDALADVRRGKVSGMEPDGESVKPSALTKTEIEALFGNENGGVDPSAYRSFLAFQHRNAETDQRFRNAHFAAQAYATDMHGIESGAGTTAGKSAGGEDGFLSRIMNAFGGGDSGVPDPAHQKSAADAAHPRSKAEYDALPAGTLYLDPDGTLRRKR